ncbi:hypothetical protein H6F89_29450 [Cyanobacteria bacterium FACHB-63]|nr:hypothetical protein [Cyanobacteria bacterium FACHB-63]
MRWWDQLSLRLVDAIIAVAQRPEQFSAKERAMILGWLVQDSLPLLQQRSSPGLLAALRQFYPLFGSGSCVKII